MIDDRFLKRLRKKARKGMRGGRLQQGAFSWPKIGDGVMRLTTARRPSLFNFAIPYCAQPLPPICAVRDRRIER
jgi:hypothetical protein